MKSMNDIHSSRSRESGVVSIFIVIFFMIFMSVIVVGFVKAVNDDQSQATDSDLSASALTSAQSGAEDGKRVLLLCRDPLSTPTVQAACATALSSTACNAITSQSALTSALNINIDNSGGRSDGIVSGNSAYQQRYTCMTVQTVTSSVEGLNVAKGSSELIPLVSVGNFSSVQFSWHATAATRNGALSAFRNNVLLPADDQWKNGTNSYAAAMRLEFIAYPKAGVNLSTLDADTRTVLLLPGVNGAPSVNSINLNALDVRATNPNLPGGSNPQLAKCQATTEYACTMNIQLTGTPNPANYNYFLKVSAIYGSGYIKAELKDVLGATVQFNNVQPLIDVTGRANDVFRRVQTRVQYDAAMYLPQYALEAGEICKNMMVTNVGSTSSDVCNP